MFKIVAISKRTVPTESDGPCIVAMDRDTFLEFSTESQAELFLNKKSSISRSSSIPQNPDNSTKITTKITLILGTSDSSKSYSDITISDSESEQLDNTPIRFEWDIDGTDPCGRNFDYEYFMKARVEYQRELTEITNMKLEDKGATN